MSGTRLELVTASASHGDFFVGGVDSGFHNNVLGNSSIPDEMQKAPSAAQNLAGRGLLGLSDSFSRERAGPQEQRPRH